ncbi:MAG: hypothetical protein ACLPX7_21735 [Xanthobacteraceae bacterium]
MANDDPTSLRMGFGYHQARLAGLGGIRADRSPRRVNRHIKHRRDERTAIEYLQNEIRKDPDWKPFVEHWIREGFNASTVLDFLWRAQRDLLYRAVGSSKRLWR